MRERRRQGKSDFTWIIAEFDEFVTGLLDILAAKIENHKLLPSTVSVGFGKKSKTFAC